MLREKQPLLPTTLSQNTYCPSTAASVPVGPSVSSQDEGHSLCFLIYRLNKQIH